SGILKADAATRFAQVLKRHGAEGLEDAPRVWDDAGFERNIREIPGQGSKSHSPTSTCSPAANSTSNRTEWCSASSRVRWGGSLLRWRQSTFFELPALASRPATRR